MSLPSVLAFKKLKKTPPPPRRKLYKCFYTIFCGNLGQKAAVSGALQP